MDPNETLVIDACLIHIQPVSDPDLNPSDSFDEPGPCLAPDFDVSDTDHGPDDSFLLDDPDDDEECDDERILELLTEYGVDFDMLDDPEAAPPDRLGSISDLVTTDDADDEVAA